MCSQARANHTVHLHQVEDGQVQELFLVNGSQAFQGCCQLMSYETAMKVLCEQPDISNAVIAAVISICMFVYKKKRARLCACVCLCVCVSVPARACACYIYPMTIINEVYFRENGIY